MSLPGRCLINRRPEKKSCGLARMPCYRRGHTDAALGRSFAISDLCQGWPLKKSQPSLPLRRDRHQIDRPCGTQPQVSRSCPRPTRRQSSMSRSNPNSCAEGAAYRWISCVPTVAWVWGRRMKRAEQVMKDIFRPLSLRGIFDHVYDSWKRRR